MVRVVETVEEATAAVRLVVVTAVEVKVAGVTAAVMAVGAKAGEGMAGEGMVEAVVMEAEKDAVARWTSLGSCTAPIWATSAGG